MYSDIHKSLNITWSTHRISSKYILIALDCRKHNIINIQLLHADICMYEIVRMLTHSARQWRLYRADEKKT